MMQESLLLIVDYNLSRIGDVAHLAHYARSAYDAGTVLVRSSPSEADTRLCDIVIDLDPLSPHFVEDALAALAPLRKRLRAGLVFSDNAVQSGASLLERLGLPVDSSRLAIAAYSKCEYRRKEAEVRELLEAQAMMVPDCAQVLGVEDVKRFASEHPAGFVIKPSCEGNNRGVVVVREGDCVEDAFRQVEPYLGNGVICEEFIPFSREFSFDGVGAVHFVTEKVSATGRYPVEVAQILPARITPSELATLTVAGRLANLLVGQRLGPFHNEIKLSDDGKCAAVVEPNRRPGGMKIWSIASAVFGVDFYARWVDTAFGSSRHFDVAPFGTQAATVMLGVSHDRSFTPPSFDAGRALFECALALAAAEQKLDSVTVRLLEFGWLFDVERFIPTVPGDNADFIAQACFAVDDPDADMRHLVAAVRRHWLTLVDDALASRELSAAVSTARPRLAVPTMTAAG